MLEPSYPGAHVWLEAVDHFKGTLQLGPTRDAAFSTDLIVVVAQAEASSADEQGGSSATAAEIAVETDLPVKEVRQIRALLIAAGLISIIHSGGHADLVTRRLHSPTVAEDERILPGLPTDR